MIVLNYANNLLLISLKKEIISNIILIIHNFLYLYVNLY